ncbi:spermine/spermidine synthase domain-containing protein [Methylomagnum sp.]
MTMRKYGGTLVHCRRDKEGLVEVVDAFGVRSLHFGTSPKQSAMSLADPDRLELSYVRAMLAGIIFSADPGRVLLLGLGGGSLAKFLLNAFPECRIDVVEYRPIVAMVAHEYFGLPEDPRLTLHIAEGGEFVCHAADNAAGEYGHIFVDIFDHEGLAVSASQHDFVSACAKLLTPDGVLAMNLWGSHAESLRHSMRLLNLYFEGGTKRLQVTGRGNVIGFGLGAEVRRLGREALRQRARILEQRHGVEFPRLLHLLTPPP